MFKKIIMATVAALCLLPFNAMAQDKKSFTLEDLMWGGNNYWNIMPSSPFTAWWGDCLLETKVDKVCALFDEKGQQQKKQRVLFTVEEVNAAIDRYADTVRRLCMLHLKNYADTEDIFQTVFLKYALHTAPFADGEHEKAWLIRVTLNACKDLLKSVFRSRTVALEAAANLPAPVPQEHQEVLEAVLALPKKYRDVVYLHYYEGYSAPEIAGLLHRNVNTIYTWLGRAKALLRTALEEGGGEDG